MNRCVAAVAAVMLVSAAHAGPSEPIRVTASMVGNLRPGQTATITWTVTGTREPLRLHLVNTNTESGVLGGGNVQTATTSGGRENVVSRKVTGLAPGSFNVTVEVDAKPTLNPKDLARTFRRELLRIASRTNKAARHLPAKGLVPTADVTALLDQALADLERSLPYPELAAFRDAAAQRVNELRREAMEKSVAWHRQEIFLVRQDAARRQRHEAIFLVRQGSPPTSRMPAREAHSLLAAFVAWLNSGAHASPLRTVCTTWPLETSAAACGRRA